jgi:precorrin-6A/cobalt-precorrin-6A reductase
MRHILILGGTSEARQLAGRLAGRSDLKVTLSLAGRTAHPAAQPVPVRVGGFGGTEGLATYLAAQRIDALVDATHPYADTIAAHAAAASRKHPDPGLAAAGMDGGGR